MKHVFPICMLVCLSVSTFAQGLWTQKASPSNNNPNNVSFTLNSVGYMYTGTTTNNFFAYDPTSNTWVAKGNFPGVGRTDAAGFATNSYGYIGTGQSTATRLNDFYKYDPVANSWSAVANYPDSVTGAFAFGMANKGYVAGGAGSAFRTTCYAYDESTNTWSAIAPLPVAMGYGVSAVVNSKGYCGVGRNATTPRINNLYEYDAVGNSWTAKSASAITSTTTDKFNAFVISNKIYVTDPIALSGTHAGIQVYDAISNTWSLIDAFPYPKSCNTFNSYAAFSISNKGYLGANVSCFTSFWQFDTAYRFAINSFTPDTVCEGDMISVDFSSNLTFGSSNFFKLKVYGTNSGVFSDSVAGTTAGTYSFKVPYGAVAGSTVASSVSVYATNAPNQTGYYAPTLFIKKAPRPVYMPPFLRSCGGSAILLYRDNMAGESHSWTSDPPGVSGSGYSLSVTPTATTSIFAYDVVTATGCSVRDTTTISFSGAPALNITDSSFAICPGGSATIGGTYTAGSSYTWTGSGLTSAAVNPVVSPTSNSTYHVLVHDTVTTCSTSGTTTVTIKQPVAQPICFVTVDSASTHNIIIWEKVDKYATDSFHIYREVTTSVYNEIGAVHRDSLSEYHDYNANPNVTAYRYKISAKDTCGSGNTLSHYHNTIHLQYLGTGNLIWNVYGIENETTPVNSFDVYWDTLANGNWQIMLNVPGNQYTATDINFSQHPNAVYKIAANWAYTCTPSRGSSSQVLSNVIAISPNGISSVSSERLSLYPNPAKNELVISGGAAVQEVSMVAMDGKIAATFYQPLNNRLDVSLLPDGIYIAAIKVNGHIEHVKWVKM